MKPWSFTFQQEAKTFCSKQPYLVQDLPCHHSPFRITSGFGSPTHTSCWRLGWVSWRGDLLRQSHWRHMAVVGHTENIQYLLELQTVSLVLQLFSTLILGSEDRQSQHQQARQSLLWHTVETSRESVGLVFRIPAVSVV